MPAQPGGGLACHCSGRSGSASQQLVRGSAQRHPWKVTGSPVVTYEWLIAGRSHLGPVREHGASAGQGSRFNQDQRHRGRHHDGDGDRPLGGHERDRQGGQPGVLVKAGASTWTGWSSTCRGSPTRSSPSRDYARWPADLRQRRRRWSARSHRQGAVQRSRWGSSSPSRSPAANGMSVDLWRASSSTTATFAVHGDQPGQPGRRSFDDPYSCCAVRIDKVPAKGSAATRKIMRAPRPLVLIAETFGAM